MWGKPTDTAATSEGSLRRKSAVCSVFRANLSRFRILEQINSGPFRSFYLNDPINNISFKLTQRRRTP